MERILVLLSLLSFNAFAAVPGNAPILTIAAPGQQTQALSVPLSSLSGTGVNGVFSLYGFTSSGVSANFYHPLYKNGTAYQVTAGKTAYCFNMTAAATTATSAFQLVYGTGAFTAGGSGTAPTGAVYQGGQASYYPLNSGATASVPGAAVGMYTFPASDYVGFQNGSASVSYYIHLECYEQ